LPTKAGRFYTIIASLRNASELIFWDTLAESLAVVDPAGPGSDGLGVFLVLLGVGTPLGPGWLFEEEGGGGDVGDFGELSASVFD
jgi:hypothetical protein